MEIQYLKEFVVLAECMSFSEAAAQLFISQSSLSKHIMTLEREIGETLFDRSTRSIVLSNAGHIFLHYATQMVQLHEDGINALEAYRTRREHTLLLAVMQNPEYYDLARYVRYFNTAHPDIILSLIEEDEMGMLTMFARKEVNLLASFELDKMNDDINFVPLVENEMVAILHKDNPLSNQSHLRISDLRTERLLLPKRNSYVSKIIFNSFKHEGIIPDIFYEGSSAGCIDLLREDYGICIHSSEFAYGLKMKPGYDEVFRILEIRPAMRYRFGLLYRDRSKLSSAENLFVEEIMKLKL